jgi:transcriptional regulator with XRE-family HTH domain
MSGQRVGKRLRDLRLGKGLGLRQAASRAGINHGYLSQLERDEITSPSPTVLQKIAAAYDEPFLMLMEWAGYVEGDPEGLSPNQARALKIVGEPSEEELKAIRAVLQAIRSGGATFSLSALDALLLDEDRIAIRQHVIATLRRADAFGEVPTPLDRVMETSKLVAAGEIELDPLLKRKLRQRFGDLVDRTLDLLLGAVRFDSREIYVKPDMYWLRERFVTAHEIGHDVLPWHRDLYAFLDDKRRIRSDVNDLYERQANHAAIEFLAQGDRLQREADDSRISFGLMEGLSDRYEISLQATFRRVVEESKHECALVISYTGSITGKLMPPHLYCSRAFEQRFRWLATGGGTEVIQNQLRNLSSGETAEPIVETDIHGKPHPMSVSYRRTPQAAFVLFRKKRRKEVF